MAVSGRKISDFNGSISVGSAEDFEHSCVPCLSDDQHVEAHGFCVDCQEYLCKNCLHCHKKTKASKHHQLLDIHKVDKHATTDQTSNICTEKCPTHRNEVIKFFCPNHEELGCTDCMTMKHKACDLEYIPDKCTGIGDSEEYKEIMSNLEKKLEEADGISKKAKERNKEIDTWHDEVMRDIKKFRKEINDHLDTLQEKIEADVAKRKSSDKQEVDAVLDACAALTSKTRKMRSNLIDFKAANQNVDLFMAIKRTQLKVQSKEAMQAEIVLRKTKTGRFECSKALENILSIDSLGTLTEYSASVASASKRSAGPTKLLTAPARKSPLSAKEDINVKTETDSQPCVISGCALLSSDKLVLTDYNNKKLKVVNTSLKTVVDEKTLNATPCDVIVLPEDQIAVTIPESEEILIMGTAGQLTTSRSIKIQRRCKGITYHQDHLYVACVLPNCILILDTKGNVKNIISCQDQTDKLNYIELSQDSQTFYISNGLGNLVAKFTLEGELSAKYSDITTPRGLLVLNDGSLLVCSSVNNSIYRLEANFKQSQQVGTGLFQPLSICCNHEKSEVYVGGQGCNQLKVFSL
ncbi:uncharacterized protein LOC123538828 [Mercenaria mercenaria]|uniref:uncharacterized protein LOC123538828 n=1 Tax=Mercenaria mercenaria TaxID=6596 RepID=UPI00234E6435|nr:uncharacterized protein LOC123538828 [Mercenaria mercenaria]